MEEELRIPKNGEVFGLGLIRHTNMAGPRMYYCFDGKIRYIRKRPGFRCCILTVFENELVLMNIKENSVVHKYTKDEIMLLSEKRLLMDLPMITGLAEQKRKEMFDKSILEESAKTKIDITANNKNNKGNVIKNGNC